MDLQTLLDLFGASIAAALIAGAFVPAIGVQVVRRRANLESNGSSS